MPGPRTPSCLLPGHTLGTKHPRRPCRDAGRATRDPQVLAESPATDAGDFGFGFFSPPLPRPNPLEGGDSSPVVPQAPQQKLFQPKLTLGEQANLLQVYHPLLALVKLVTAHDWPQPVSTFRPNAHSGDIQPARCTARKPTPDISSPLSSNIHISDFAQLHHLPPLTMHAVR